MNAERRQGQRCFTFDGSDGSSGYLAPELAAGQAAAFRTLQGPPEPDRGEVWLRAWAEREAAAAADEGTDAAEAEQRGDEGRASRDLCNAQQAHVVAVPDCGSPAPKVR